MIGHENFWGKEGAGMVTEMDVANHGFVRNMSLFKGLDNEAWRGKSINKESDGSEQETGYNAIDDQRKGGGFMIDPLLC